MTWFRGTSYLDDDEEREQMRYSSQYTIDDRRCFFTGLDIKREAHRGRQVTRVN